MEADQVTTARLPNSVRRLSRAQWLIGAGIAIAAVIFGFLRGGHFANAEAGIGFADSYWTQFWLTTYQDGFARRSLLGSLLSQVVAPGSSVAILSVLHLAISAGLLLAGMGIVMRLTLGAGRPRVALLCAALFGFSPVAPMLFETTGDPLQSAMLVWLAGVFGATRLPERGRVLVLLMVCGLAVLIHEASAFFVLPHLLLTAPAIRRLEPMQRVILVAFAVWLVAGAIGLLTSDSVGVPRFFLTNTANGSRIVADSSATPGFFEVFRQEMHESYGTQAEALRRGARLLCFPVVPLGLIFFFASFSPHRFVLAPMFGAWLVCAAPLFVIAHDWGRFGVLILYAILTALLADEERLQLGEATARLEQLWRRAAARLARSAREMTIARVVMALVVLSSSIIWEDYRVVGGRMSLFLAIPTVLLAAALYAARGKGPRSAAV